MVKEVELLLASSSLQMDTISIFPPEDLKPWLN